MTYEIGKRRCWICKETKDMQEFTKSKNKQFGHTYECKECIARNKRNKMLHLKMYGMSINDYNKMLKEQNGVCKLCKKEQEILFVDHDHSTKKVRGLLCRNCNALLGFIERNTSVIKEIQNYLDSPQSEFFEKK